MPEPVPRRIGSFEIVSPIGKGAMGEVYLAKWLEDELERPVALKILSTQVASDAETIGRLRQESRSASVLKHENIVQAIDFGESDGFHYFAMEYVKGRTLQEILLGEGPMEEMRALRIARQIASALHLAARFRIVHRDIKPSNIIVTPGGIAKLADFGISKEFRSPVAGTGAKRFPMEALPDETATFGTPWYMSPEQFRGEPLDIRSDIYSLGATLYRTLTGATPHAAPTLLELMRKCLEEDPLDPREIRPDISESASRLVLAMLERDREGRLQSPEGVLFWIDTIRTGREPPPVDLEPVEEEPSPSRPKPIPRRPPPGRAPGPRRFPR